MSLNSVCTRLVHVCLKMYQNELFPKVIKYFMPHFVYQKMNAKRTLKRYTKRYTNGYQILSFIKMGPKKWVDSFCSFQRDSLLKRLKKIVKNFIFHFDRTLQTLTSRPVKLQTLAISFCDLKYLLKIENKKNKCGRILSPPSRKIDRLSACRH